MAQIPEGWKELFWFGTQPQGDASAYPPPEEVVSFARERRKTLLKALDELSDEELNAPAPAKGEPSPIAGAPNMGYAFLFLAYHEGLHTGQLSIARRALGNRPLRG